LTFIRCFAISPAPNVRLACINVHVQIVDVNRPAVRRE
jgi:hypothetical protein